MTEYSIYMQNQFKKSGSQLGNSEITLSNVQDYIAWRIRESKIGFTKWNIQTLSYYEHDDNHMLYVLLRIEKGDMIVTQSFKVKMSWVGDWNDKNKAAMRKLDAVITPGLSKRSKKTVAKKQAVGRTTRSKKQCKTK